MTAKRSKADWRVRLGSAMATYGSVVALAMLLLVGSRLSESFISIANFNNILRQNSVVGIIAVGMTFVIILGGIDLSVGSLVAMLGGLGILAMNTASAAGAPDWLAIVVGASVMVLGGPLVGMGSGVLIAKGRIAPFIATLGGMAAFRSISLAAADGGEFRSAVSAFGVIGSGGIEIPFVQISEGVAMRVHYPVLAFLIVAAVAHVVLRRTTLGTYIHAIGDNDRAARYAAIPVDRVRIVTYGISGLACGIGALLIASRLNSVSSSQTGTLYELDAIAAVVVGGTRMQGGAGRVWGTVVGVLLLGVVNNMLNMVSSSETLRWLGLGSVNMIHLQGLVKGAIIVAAVLVQRPGRQA
ncbi:MAG: ABC transporter permease [Phycisphaeraceae bacterium]|nr:ABC transporter permease [Phycisphaeraceae bacterium]